MRSHLLIYGMNYSPELTGVGRYTGELAAGMAELGHSVDVVTTPPHYPGWYVRAPYSAWLFASEERSGVRVQRCPLSLYRAGTGFWRLLAPLSFAISSAVPFIWRALVRRPRVVLCIEPTLCIAPLALMMAWVVGSKTVLHVQDLEVDAAFAVGHLPARGWLQRIAVQVEKWLLKRFDEVVTISEAMAVHLERKGVSGSRISVIRNWVDTERIFPIQGPNDYRTKLGFREEDFVVLYAGQIGPKQALHVVLEAAAELRAADGVKFVIAGEGPDKQSLIERYGELPHVHFMGVQPEERLNELLNMPDCHVLPQAPAVSDLVLPSKLGGMLASGKQIIAMAREDSELGGFLNGSAKLILPGDIPALVSAVLVARERETHDPAIALEKAHSLSAAQALRSFEAHLADAEVHRAG